MLFASVLKDIQAPQGIPTLDGEHSHGAGNIHIGWGFPKIWWGTTIFSSSPLSSLLPITIPLHTATPLLLCACAPPPDIGTPCKVLLQPINELTGLILKWEALLWLKYFSDILQIGLHTMAAAFFIIRQLTPNLLWLKYFSDIPQTSDSAWWLQHFSLSDNLCPTQLCSDVFPPHNVPPFLFPDLFSQLPCPPD